MNQHAPNVFVSTYDPAILEYAFPEWPALSKRAKLALLRAHEPGPRERVRESNTTTRALHRYLAQTIDPEHDAEGFVQSVAFGTGGATGTSVEDTDVNTRVGIVQVTDTVYSPSVAEVQITAFVDSSELNGNLLDEVGVVSDGGDLWNHAVLNPAVDKTASKTLVVDIFLSFGTA